MTSKLAIKSFSEIPGPRLLPIIGNLLTYKIGKFNYTKYHLVLQDLYKNYGPLVRERLGNKTIVHVFDPEDIKTVYANEGKWPTIPPLQETTQIYRQQKEMSLGLGNTNGEEWYRLRTNSQQKLLRPKEVQRHLGSVNKVAQDFVAYLESIKNKETLEIENLRTEVGRWSLENAAMIIFEKRLNCFTEEGEELGYKMTEANATIFKYSGILKFSLPIYKYISTPKWNTLIKTEDYFYSIAINLAKDAFSRLENKDELSQDNQFYILSYLMSRENLTIKDVTILCLSIFSDGLSTTTPTILFNLFCLASNPRIQDNVYKEIQEVIGNSKDITHDHINKMVYMKAFIKETFRLWPNGTEVSRYTEKPMTLSGYDIPCGTHVDLNPSVHFRDENIFKDPHQHIPERWLRSTSQNDNYVTNVHPYLLTPFGHGTRMCAGRRFAEQDLHVVLATILRKFRLEYPIEECEPMEQIYNTLLFPSQPIRARFIPRI